MATVTIRNLSDEVRDALRRRGAAKGRSMEAEARDLLTQAVREKPTREDARAILERFWANAPAQGPVEPEGWSGVDAFLAEKRIEAAWEAGTITDEERSLWLDRLERFEASPSEAEAFVASRSRS